MTNVNDSQSKRKTKSIRAKALMSRKHPLYVVTQCFITIVSCTASLVHIHITNIAVSFIHTFLVFNSVTLPSISCVRHVTEEERELISLTSDAGLIVASHADSFKVAEHSFRAVSGVVLKLARPSKKQNKHGDKIFFVVFLVVWQMPYKVTVCLFVCLFQTK